MEHQIISVDGLTPVPWQNGRGTTRPIAVEEGPSPGRGQAGGVRPAGESEGAPAGPGFLWRLSLADLVSDGEFSALPGVDRVFTLVTDGPLEMRLGSETRTVTGGRPQAFAGELPVSVALGAAGPQQALNLMVDRSRACGAVEIVELSEGSMPLSEADVAVVVLSGRVALADGRELCRLEVLRPGGPQLSVSDGTGRAARIQVE